jgi:hypothetical protein
VKLMRFFGHCALALVLCVAVADSLSAQTRPAQTRTTRPQSTQGSVTTADIQRLQDTIYDASRDLSQMRGRDTSLASQLEAELDEAHDDAIYLKVKLRKRESVSRSEYLDVRDRVDSIRSRARRETTSTGYTPSGGGGNPDWENRDNRSVPPGSSSRVTANEIPVGTEFDVSLVTPLSSKTAQVEDRFEATTMVDLRDDRNRVVVPAGSTMRGVISSVNKAGRIERKGSLTVAFDRITMNGRSYPIRGTVTQALESEGIKGEAAKIGIGAGAGAILGAILGGAKGALAGILIGGGGTIAATEGTDVELPAGTVLRVRMDAPLNLTTTR